jgi:phosphoglucosamine mutase
MTKLFGTDGIRGIAGEFPLDQHTIELIGRSLVSNLRAELGHVPSLVTGRDTRESGQAIEGALTAGARSQGATVRSSGVITTPGVAFLAKNVPFDAGVVISASHNPYQDNGIKIFSPSGKKLADELERKIEVDIAKWVGGALQNDRTSGDGESPAVDGNDAYDEMYQDYLIAQVGRGLNLAALRLAIDCANGAAYRIAPAVFSRLGANVSVLGADPDGRNINEACGSLHPELLQATVVNKHLDIGIAFDGDADRVLFVDNRGAVVDGDHMMLILAEHLKSRRKLKANVVVTTVMSNIGLEIALRQRGIGMVRTSVGDRYVLEELLSLGASLGGEQSGHVIFPDISLAGDGIITAIEVLRAVSEVGRPLAELASQLERYPQVLLNLRVLRKPPIESMPSVRSIIDDVEKSLQGQGRVLVRYSGTENLARVMIEGQNDADIRHQADRIAAALRAEIGAN